MSARVREILMRRTNSGNALVPWGPKPRGRVARFFRPARSRNMHPFLRTPKRGQGGRLTVQIFACFLVGVAIVASAWLVPTYLSAGDDTISAFRISVVDGDTIKVLGALRSVRLVGFNAPETYEPQCDREARIGEQAKEKLREVIAAGDLTLTYVARSCRPGTEGTNACNYGRACGKLRANGRDVGRILISAGLAVPFVCGSTRCPPTPRPWCG